MNVYILNENFDVTFVLDYYESFMWVDRYFSYGEFEIYAPFSSNYINNLIQGYYVQIDSSDSTMIIENIQLQTDADTGSHLIIKGRSLESILDRRIIWPMMEIKGSNCYLEKAIKLLIDDCIIDPRRSRGTYIRDLNKLRKIPNFDFISLDPETDWYYNIKDLPIEEVEMTGDNLYDVIRNWCTDLDVSFKITLGSDKRFKFKLYYGVDRSYNQGDNPTNLYVIFSPEFDNIISTNYIDDISPWKNYAVIAGEGEGDERIAYTYGAMKSEALHHRELFVDARDLQSSEIPEGYSSYKEALIARGIEQLNENYKDIEFTGEVEAKRQFAYGRDFFIGDIVQLVNLYGITGSARVTEFIINETDNGIEMYPTFEAIQNEGYEEEEEI